MLTVVVRGTIATSARRSTAATGPSAVAGSWARRAPGIFMNCTSPAKASVTGRRTVWPWVDFARLVLLGTAAVAVASGRCSPRWQAAEARVATIRNAAARADTRADRGTGRTATALRHLSAWTTG